MATTRVGVLIGRFQVPALHEGHQRLLQSVRTDSDKVVVLLGVSPVDGHVPENPLTYSQRLPLFRGLADAVLPLFDERTNERWSLQIDRLLLSTYQNAEIVLYGGRQSFIDAYSGNLTTKHLDMQPAVTDEGTRHRQAIRESDATDFSRGCIYTLNNQWPRVHQAVDIALVRRPDVLLIRRADTGEWALPGGFVDPTKDASLEQAGVRELREETGLSPAEPLAYITSTIVDDWRYRGSKDKIMSALYLGWYAFGAPVLDRSEAQDSKWAKIDGEAVDIISATHAPLLRALHERVRP